MELLNISYCWDLINESSLTFRLGHYAMTLRVKLSLPQIANWQYMIYISVLGVFQAMYIV